MDISGETQTDISHNVVKTRLDSKGEMVPNSAISQLGSDLDKISNVKQDNYCGSCYGGTEPEGGCCNTCESVRQAYVNRGWSFSDPEAIDQVCTRKWRLRIPYLMVLQCKNEKWADKLKEQADEGCNVSGRIRVNKVVGNIHLSPGRSFQTSSRNLYELVPYLREEKDRHDFSHTIHQLAFESEFFPFFFFWLSVSKTGLGDDEYDYWKAEAGNAMRDRMGLAENPLDGVVARVCTPHIVFLFSESNNGCQQTSKSLYMFQYFIKVVSTQFRTLDGQKVRLHRLFHEIDDLHCANFVIRSTHISIVPQNLNVTYRKGQTAILLEAFTYNTVWAVCQVCYIYIEAS